MVRFSLFRNKRFVLNSIRGNVHEMKNEKNYMGFLILKIWQILKHFTRVLSWAQTCYFWRVFWITTFKKVHNFWLLGSVFWEIRSFNVQIWDTKTRVWLIWGSNFVIQRFGKFKVQNFQIRFKMNQNIFLYSDS